MLLYPYAWLAHQYDDERFFADYGDPIFNGSAVGSWSSARSTPKTYDQIYRHGIRYVNLRDSF